MKLIAPDYYRRFRCIAESCVHSCCVGWEIDVDDVSLARYRAMAGPFAARLNAAIEDGDPAHFRLGDHERCPMLNESGLCDLITECGEDALCQICADHPRFRSYFADRTEVGLGLCCEAAASLVLGQEAPVRFLPLEDDGEETPLPEEEADLLALREDCIAVMQDRELPLDIRLEKLMLLIDDPFTLAPDADWVAVYRSLNRLDPAWDEALDLLGGAWDVLPHLETALEQFGVYLLYRHLPGALEDGDPEGRVKLCVLSVRMLAALCHAHARKHGACTLHDCAEYARMYSSEVEYDQDNIDELLNALD